MNREWKVVSLCADVSDSRIAEMLNEQEQSGWLYHHETVFYTDGVDGCGGFATITYYFTRTIVGQVP